MKTRCASHNKIIKINKIMVLLFFFYPRRKKIVIFRSKSISGCTILCQQHNPRY